MAKKPPALMVVYHSRALDALTEIWNWNAERYSAEHADAYLTFLRGEIDRLSSQLPLGRPVPTRPQFRYVLIQRKPRTHGHVAIFRILGATLQVMDLFHTAQDWQEQVARISY